jgi:Cof subfamily protein (haloacid dehalogenase superfamily)
MLTKKPHLDQFKIVVFDLDGTLITHDYLLLPENLNAVNQIRQLGLRVTIATGRSFFSAEPFLKQLQIQEPMVFSNGSVCDNPETGDREIISGIPLESALIILMLMDQFKGLSLKVHTADGTVLKSNDIPWPDEGVHFVVGTIIDNLKAYLDQDPIKMVIFGEPEVKNKFQQKLLEVLGSKSQISLTHSHPLYLEIISKNVSKGITICHLLPKLGILPEQAIGVGDQENDYEMLKMLGLGIQVGENAEILKTVTQHQIPNPETLGIKVLYEWLTSLPK